jgi:hypothetical protein
MPISEYRCDGQGDACDPDDDTTVWLMQMIVLRGYYNGSLLLFT